MYAATSQITIEFYHYSDQTDLTALLYQMMYVYIYPDTAKHQSKPQVYSTLWSDIKSAVQTDYKKTMLTFSKVPTKM